MGKLRNAYYVYRRQAMGTRGTPLSWCRFMALVLRLSQSLFREREARLNGYVDDPAASLGGPQELRDFIVASIVLLWRCLNLALAFAKGQGGPQIDRIGFRFAQDAAAKHILVSLRPAWPSS